MDRRALEFTPLSRVSGTGVVFLDRALQPQVTDDELVRLLRFWAHGSRVPRDELATRLWRAARPLGRPELASRADSDAFLAECIDAGLLVSPGEWTEHELGRASLPIAGGDIGLWMHAAIALRCHFELSPDGRGVRLLPAGRAPFALYDGWIEGESARAIRSALDKAKTLRTLARAGIPVPRSFEVRSETGLWNKLARIAPRWVVKPRDGWAGLGVRVGVGSAPELADAIAWSRAVAIEQGMGPWLIVEEQCSGRELRVAVAEGKVIAAIEKRLPALRSDGRRTLREQVAVENVRRKARGEKPLPEPAVDGDKVPARGRHVVLSRVANLANGATHHYRPQRVHPKTAALLARAVERIGLRLAGLDLFATDLGQPPSRAGVRIIEVNAQPGFRVSGEPGDPAAMYKDVLRALITR